MSGSSYRLTVYENGLIDRMLPFEAENVPEAMAFAESQRYGRRAVLSDGRGLVKEYPTDAHRGVAARPVVLGWPAALKSTDA